MLKAVLLSFLFGSTYSQDAEYCRALALSGGGNNGAWETGILWGLMHYGNPEDFQWDVVSGVSAGAINSSAVVLFPKGMEVEMSEYMDYLWQTLRTEDIYEKWLGGLSAALWKPSIFNDEPAVEFLANVQGNFTDGPVRTLIVGTVDIGNGTYVHFDSDLDDWTKFPEYVMSSASIPAVFQPRYVDGRYHMDGGTVWNTNIATAIQKCYEKTGDYSKISLDIANCDAHHPVFNNETSHNALENYMRQRAIHKFHKKTNDILEVKRAYPEVNYRYYFQPSGETNSGLSELDFYNSTTWRVNEMGRRDAKATLEAGENFGFEMLEQYHFNQEVKKAYPNYTDYFKKMFGFE